MVNTDNNLKSEPTRVGVIGCGWLGSALVKALVELNYCVVATTQQQEKLNLIQKLGAQAEILSLPFGEFNANSAAVFYCETLIICIPPGLRKGKKDYPEKVTEIVNQAQKGTVKKIILISTTAIYEGIIGDVTESAKLKLNSEKVSILSQAEQAVIAFHGQGIILRSAGLVGPQRHPGIFFRNKKLLTSPNSYVNLIHQNDIVALLILLIKKEKVTGIFNAVSEMQVTKKHYYSIAAKALKLPMPIFDEHSEVELGKKIIGDKLRDFINYQYQHDDLVSWLIHQE
jgi:nucleoside-diphosphate-sugar epimerase